MPFSYGNVYLKLVKAMVFPVVMYECESWIVKKTECEESWTVKN